MRCCACNPIVSAGPFVVQYARAAMAAKGESHEQTYDIFGTEEDPLREQLV